ncbi:MAG: ribose-phosphate diphosphokinase [Candidatus Anstonellales archaeon]
MPSASDLAEPNVIVQKFKDGEIYIKENAPKAEEIVMRAWPEPNDSLVELMLLLSHYRGSVKRVVMPYLPYARQDREKIKGEVVSFREFVRIISSFGVRELFGCNIHSSKEHKEVYVEGLLVASFDAIRPLLVKAEAKEVVGADEGMLHITPKCITKERTGTGTDTQIVSRNFPAVESDTVWIVDDIIATGSTMLEAAKHYSENGKEVIAIASHALLLGNAEAELKRHVKKLYTTTSIIREKNPWIEEMEVWKVLV